MRASCDRDSNAGDAVRFLNRLTRQICFGVRNDKQVRERGIGACLSRSAAHFENAPGGASRQIGRDFCEHRYCRAA